MPLVVEYKGYYTPLDVPTQEFDEWKSTLIGERERIYNSLKTRIPDETVFKLLIAEPSHLVYKDFVNPNWEDKDFVLLKHRIKLATAYPAWKVGIDNAFDGEKPYFGDRVLQKAEKWLKARYTLGSTGIRYRYGVGIAVKAIGVISGWKAITKDIKAPDEFTGTVTNVFLPGVAKFVRPQAIAIITRGLVLAQYAHEAGEASLRDSIISATNTVLSNSVLKQVNTAAYVVTLEIGFDAGVGKLFARSKAETPTA